jgi:putative heme iron utilization protein
MNTELSERMAQLLQQRSTAALGTLRDAAPFVSMVPYAIAADGSGFVVHVSKLAAHTKNMLADVRVSLLVAELEGGEKSALALARVSLQGTARRIPSGSTDLSGCRAAYLARFPEAEQMFDFTDFSFFLIRPVSVRFVAGFGEAHSLSAETLAQLLQQR